MAMTPPETETGKWPKVSVLVPAWNEQLTLRACLQSLHQVSYAGEWETVVIAGGADGSYELARRLALRGGVRVIEQGPNGKNAALNRGLEGAQGEVIVVLDADSAVAPGWLRALVAPLEGRIGASTGRFLPIRETLVTAAELLEQEVVRRIDGSTTLQGSGSIAITRAAIEAIGGFPQEVRVGVDWDLDARLRRAGVDIAYCDDAVVRTHRPATLREFWSNEVRWRRAHLGALLRLWRGGVLNGTAAMAGLYLYGLAWLVAGATVTAAARLFVGQGAIAGSWWLLLVLWLSLRRLSPTLALAAWRRDVRPLAIAWLPALLLWLTLAAIIPASLTLSQTTPHFRGPRHVAHPDHAR